MFGKHNAPKSSRETSIGEQTPEANSIWQETMSDMPTFGQHMSEKVSTEPEKTPLNLESLREVTGFTEQLGKMGANQEILSNPAFKRVLEKVLSESGLKFGANLEASNNSDNSKLDFSCLRDKNSFLGSSQHDCSNFQVNVKEDGNFTIDYAYVDREKRTMSRDIFSNSNAKLPPHAETVDVYGDTNSASRLEFVKHQNGNGFNLTIMDSYEDQLSPITDSKNLKVGLYTESRSTSERSFNADGIETTRSDISYKPKEYQDANLLFTFIKPTDSWGNHAPSRASFNSLMTFEQDHYSSSNIAESATHYSRNPDGNTAKISGYDRNGKFSSDSVPLDTQYGTDDIIVSNGVNIEGLRSASAE